MDFNKFVDWSIVGMAWLMVGLIFIPACSQQVKSQRVVSQDEVQLERQLNNVGYRIATIQGCSYLEKTYGVAPLIHMGSCPNPMHQCRCK